jgi:hypothetical protein
MEVMRGLRDYFDVYKKGGVRRVNVQVKPSDLAEYQERNEPDEAKGVSDGGMGIYGDQR